MTSACMSRKVSTRARKERCSGLAARASDTPTAARQVTDQRHKCRRCHHRILTTAKTVPLGVSVNTQQSWQYSRSSSSNSMKRLVMLESTKAYENENGNAQLELLVYILFDLRCCFHDESSHCRTGDADIAKPSCCRGVGLQ